MEAINWNKPCNSPLQRPWMKVGRDRLKSGDVWPLVTSVPDSPVQHLSEVAHTQCKHGWGSVLWHCQTPTWLVWALSLAHHREAWEWAYVEHCFINTSWTWVAENADVKVFQVFLKHLVHVYPCVLQSACRMYAHYKKKKLDIWTIELLSTEISILHRYYIGICLFKYIYYHCTQVLLGY